MHNRSRLYENYAEKSDSTSDLTSACCLSRSKDRETATAVMWTIETFAPPCAKGPMFLSVSFRHHRFALGSSTPTLMRRKFKRADLLAVQRLAVCSRSNDRRDRSRFRAGKVAVLWRLLFTSCMVGCLCTYARRCFFFLLKCERQ